MVVYTTFDIIPKGEKQPIAVCGTKSLYVGEAKEGAKLFKSLCASCHKLDKKLIGPALGNYSSDLLTMHQYLVSEKHTPSFSQLSLNDVEKILEYLEN